MADVVLAQRVDDAGLAGRVTVDSCGTGDWHVGQPMDERAAADPARRTTTTRRAHRARQFSTALAGRPTTWSWRWTRSNLADVRRVAAGRVEPSRTGSGCSATSTPSNRVARCPDPYYGGEHGFEEVLAMVERTCAVLVSALQQLPDLRDASGRAAT